MRALSVGKDHAPGIRLIIKPHPAETPDVYAPVVSGIVNISMAATTTDLARLLAAADAIITMNSTVAIDGLALGVPAGVLVAVGLGIDFRDRRVALVLVPAVALVLVAVILGGR